MATAKRDLGEDSLAIAIALGTHVGYCCAGVLYQLLRFALLSYLVGITREASTPLQGGAGCCANACPTPMGARGEGSSLNAAVHNNTTKKKQTQSVEPNVLGCCQVSMNTSEF